MCVGEAETDLEEPSDQTPWSAIEEEQVYVGNYEQYICDLSESCEYTIPPPPPPPSLSLIGSGPAVMISSPSTLPELTLRRSINLLTLYQPMMHICVMDVLTSSIRLMEFIRGV